MFNVVSNAWLELQWYFNAAVFLLISGFALKRNEHVRIDVINGKLPARAKAWIDILGGMFMLLPTVAIIAWYSWPSLVNSWSSSASRSSRVSCPPATSRKRRTMPFELMAPMMFGGLVVFLLLDYPVAFSLAANGLMFGAVGMAHDNIEPVLLQALPERAL